MTCCLTMSEGKGVYTDSHSWKTFVVLHSVVHEKRDRNSCVKNVKRELEKALSVRKCPSQIKCLKGVGGGGFQS